MIGHFGVCPQNPTGRHDSEHRFKRLSATIANSLPVLVQNRGICIGELEKNTQDGLEPKTVFMNLAAGMIQVLVEAIRCPDSISREVDMVSPAHGRFTGLPTALPARIGTGQHQYQNRTPVPCSLAVLACTGTFLPARSLKTI